MLELPQKFILSRHPKQYLKQGLSHCGMYSVKAILSAYGKDEKEYPKDYHTNWVGRHLFSFAIGKRYHEKILESYGLKAESDTAKNLLDKDRLILLKASLAQDNPVMMLIGNGYIRSCTYNPLLGSLIAHWITLWGYDDGKKLFYVYDSGLEKKCWDKNLSIGNTTRTYQEILRDWNFGGKLWHFLAWNNSRKPYFHIKVSNPSAKVQKEAEVL